jgi:hypothetical protein
VAKAAQDKPTTNTNNEEDMQDSIGPGGHNRSGVINNRNPGGRKKNQD